MARTLKASVAISSFAERIFLRSLSSNALIPSPFKRDEQRSRITSGAPFIKALRLPPSILWIVVILFLSELKGNSPILGHCSLVSSLPSPALAARTTRAPSVGSPLTDHLPPASKSVASLHRIPPLKSMCREGLLEAGFKLPSGA